MVPDLPQEDEYDGHPTVARNRWRELLKYLGMYPEYRRQCRHLAHDKQITLRQAQMRLDPIFFAKLSPDMQTKATSGRGSIFNDKDSKVLPPVSFNKADFEGKAKVSRNAIVDWVFENMDVEDVKPTDAPSPGAFSLLRRAQKNPKILESVYTMWAKGLPTKSQIQTESAGEDDGREITLDLIDRVKAAREKADKSAPKQTLPEQKVVAVGPMGNTVH